MLLRTLLAALAALLLVTDRRGGANRLHRANHGDGQGHERRRAAGCRRHRDSDRHRVPARRGHRGNGLFVLSNLPGRAVPARSHARRLPRVPADRHRAAGECQPRNQHHAVARRDHRDGRRAGGDTARRNAQPRHRPGDRQRAHRGAAAQRPQPGGSDHARRRGGAAAGPRRDQPQHAGRPRDCRGRRPELRRRLHARRRHAQQSLRQPEPAAALPRRPAGVPARDQLHHREQRRALERVGERGHQVGHQRLPRRPVRVRPQPPLQRDQSLQRREPGHRRAPGRRPEPPPVRRHVRRPSADRPAVLLRGVSGDTAPRDAGRPVRLRADGGDAGRRLHAVRVGRLQHRRERHAPRAVRRQPRRPVAPEPRGDEDRRTAAHDQRPLRPFQLQPEPPAGRSSNTSARSICS